MKPRSSCAATSRPWIPPKATAVRALAALHKHGIAVKILPGDNPLISRKVCKDVGLAAERTALFARLLPLHKERVIRILRGKYIRMGSSSNFGSMLSVLGASAFLPFLPMAPIQVLTNHLLHDFSQVPIPSDAVDDEHVARPMTQTLIIHVIRTNKGPFVQSRASWRLTLMTILIMGVGAWLPYSPPAPALGFTELPLSCWPILLVTLLAYMSLTQGIKIWLLRRRWI